MIGALLLVAVQMTVQGTEPLTRYSFREIAMGCEVRIELFAHSHLEAARNARVAFDRVKELDERLSDYRAASEVSRLCNDAGCATLITADLAAVISESLRVSRATEGAFDASAGALSRVWREARVRGARPTDQEIALARGQCGFESLVLSADPRRVTFKLSGIRLDFGAIGKGFAAQAAIERMAASGASRALCAIAGDIACGDAPPDAAGWTIDVASELADVAVRRVVLRNQSISTSGDASQHLDVEGERFSHIFDPRTGRAVTRRIAATVVSRSGAVADALATALCIDGEALVARAAQIAQQCGEFEARVVELKAAYEGALASVKMTETPGWKSLQESPPALVAMDQTAATLASDSSGSQEPHPK